jgi:hypothetical protein
MKKYAIFLLLLLLCPLTSKAADYNFGGDTTGATGVARVDSLYDADTMTTPANSGNLDSVVVWLGDNYHGPHSVGVAIYNADSTLLDSTAHFAVSGESKTRYRADFIENAAISSETMYFVMTHAASEGGTDGTYKMFCNTSITPDWWYKSAQPVIPATITAPSKTSGYARAIMVYYSDGGEAPELKGRRRRIMLLGQ